MTFTPSMLRNEILRGRSFSVTSIVPFSRFPAASTEMWNRAPTPVPPAGSTSSYRTIRRM